MARKKPKLFESATPSTSVEEVLNRSHRGIQVDSSKPLKKKSNDPEILKALLSIEEAIIEKARKQKII